MARFGISPKNNFGVLIPTLRKLAKEIGKNHSLSLKLWKSKIHDARLLAIFIDDPGQVTEKQMDSWVSDFDSWDVCDQCCSTLFDKSKLVHKKIVQWSKDSREFVRRAGLVLIATSAVHHKQWLDKDFIKYLPLIKKYSIDERNFVKKAVNWALRQIGKRNAKLSKAAIGCAKEIQKIDAKAAKWVARDALRELNMVKSKRQRRKHAK